MKWVYINQSVYKIDHYRQTSNVGHTKSTNLNISRLRLQMCLPNPLKTGVISRVKM